MEKFNRTVKRALDILELVKNSDHPLCGKEIAQRMDMPQASAFDITKTLLMEGYLEYANPSSKSYVIGVKCFEIGSGYISHMDLVQIAQPYTEKLMRLSNSTSFLAGVYKNQIIYLNKTEAPTSVRTSAVLGSRRDLGNTGLGKAILACYPEERVAEIFRETRFTETTEHTIRTLDALRADLEKTRRRGYAIDDREGNIDVYCIAAPIRDHTGEPVAAVSVAMLYSMKTDELMGTLSRAISDSALEISRKIGYTGQLY